MPFLTITKLLMKLKNEYLAAFEFHRGVACPTCFQLGPFTVYTLEKYMADPNYCLCWRSGLCCGFGKNYFHSTSFSQRYILKGWYNIYGKRSFVLKLEWPCYCIYLIQMLNECIHGSVRFRWTGHVHVQLITIGQCVQTQHKCHIVM